MLLMRLVPKKMESTSGFSQAQPVATEVAPASESSKSDLSRTTADKI